jgi:hypothetical protein
MTQTTFTQEPERLPARTIWLVGASVVALSAVLVGIAWLLVAPPTVAERPTPAPSSLEHELFDRATGGDDLRTAGARRLERYEWIDRGARVVRIPIDRAIDAVVADPSLIGARSPAIAGAVVGGVTGEGQP